MRQRLRSHLTYANVMATIAVFVAVGGGSAFALAGHNTVFSDDIVNGQVKLADTNVRLRLHCPTGTRYHEGACIEKVARPPMTWTPAANDCKDEGRRLPTVAELSTFRLEPGIALGGPVEWTLELDQDSSMASAVGESGNLVSASTTTSLIYRCAARPKL